MRYREEYYTALIALLAACLIAATETRQGGLAGLIGNYVYWIVRIFIEGLLFVAVRQVLERYAPKSAATAAIIGAAIAISLVPFVLSVTALDLILGYPELGIGATQDAAQTRYSAFALELFFLLDNHILLCLLLTLPQILLGRASGREGRLPGLAEPDSRDGGAPPQTLISGIDPPLKGQIVWVEAQEHYVRIATSEEVRMVLCRFSDFLRELPDTDGMQVHRSHWIAYSAIQDAFKEGQGLKLKLLSGDVVPVSRSFRSAIQTKLDRMAVQLVNSDSD